MPNVDWFPRRQTDKKDWYDNFKVRVAAIATTLQLDAADALAGATDWLKSHNDWTAARDVAAGKADALQDQDPLSERAIRAFIKLLKATPGVTEEMLAELRCNTPESDPAARGERPVLDIELEGGQVEIKFRKQGHQGVLIYSRRGTETEWVLLALDTSSPYVDTRPNLVAGQPEDRHYRAYFADRDVATGQVSDVATIAVRG